MLFILSIFSKSIGEEYFLECFVAAVVDRGQSFIVFEYFAFTFEKEDNDLLVAVFCSKV